MYPPTLRTSRPTPSLPELFRMNPGRSCIYRMYLQDVEASEEVAVEEGLEEAYIFFAALEEVLDLKGT